MGTGAGKPPCWFACDVCGVNPHPVGPSQRPQCLASGLHPCVHCQAGACGEECKTAERAAEQIMGEHDTDVAEALFVVRRLDEWLNTLELLCTAAKACT